jgi:hypothetical protein
MGVLPVDFAVAAEAEGVVTNQRLREQIAALDAGDGGPWEAGYAAAIKDVLALLPADEPTAAQEKFPGAARNAEEMKIYQAGYDHGFRDGEQSASGNRGVSHEA